MATPVSKREIWRLLQDNGLDQPLGVSMGDLVAMLERVSPPLPERSGGPFAAIRITTGDGQYVWAKRQS